MPLQTSGFSNDSVSADVIVIGSGPGGSVAGTIIAEAGKSVVMLEEGQHLSLDSAPHFSREEILQKYRNAGINIALGRSKLAYVEGRCVGGGSEINRGLYHRISDTVLGAWRLACDVQNLSLDALVPHFEACEETAKVEYLPGPAPLISRRLDDGARNLGWSSIEVPRLYAYGKNSRSGAPGRKQSMSETFVPRFIVAGGEIVPDTRVIKIARSNGRWFVKARVTHLNGSLSEREYSAKSVFLSCGAVQTPALLRRSGMRKNVGDSLRFHPMLKVVALFTEEINSPGGLEPVHQIKEFDPRFSMGCSMSKRPALAMAMAAHPSMMTQVDREWQRMAIYYVQSTGGRATVRNLPGFADPLVRVQLGPEDLNELAVGLAKLAEVLFAAGAEAIYPSITGYPVLRSVTDIAKLPPTLLPQKANATALHLFSSCPMGENKAVCVADSFGRVHGTEGLFIADSSLLCGPTVVNPQGTVMAVARRTALRAVEDRLV